MTKKEDRLKKIRDFLLEQKKATWTEIQTNTKIQPKELASDLKELLDKREVVTESDAKDRRKTWYKLKDKSRTLAESRRYEATKFIEDMKEPIYYEVQKSIGEYKVSMSAFSEYPPTQPIMREKAREIYENFLDQSIKGISESWLQLIKPVDKLALVLAFEKRE